MEPLQNVQRWLKEKKARGFVPQPNLFKTYCSFMGGVDKHDWLISKYATAIRSKKWCWLLFTRILDMAVVNAFIIYKFVHADDKDNAACKDLLSFRRDICRFYLRLASNRVPPGKKRSCPGRPSSNPSDVRFSFTGHIVMKRAEQRAELKNKPCTARPRTYCSKCYVTLCVDCFSSYHKNNSWSSNE